MCKVVNITLSLPNIYYKNTPFFVIIFCHNVNDLTYTHYYYQLMLEKLKNILLEKLSKVITFLLLNSRILYFKIYKDTVISYISIYISILSIEIILMFYHIIQNYRINIYIYNLTFF